VTHVIHDKILVEILPQANFAIELEDVTKTFGGHIAVDALSLRVPVGSVYGFIGPNGSGKTTTLRMIMRIIRPDRGRVIVLGGEGSSAANDRVGYLPEERGLYRQMKVIDLLRFHSQLKGHVPGRGEIEHWLQRLELSQWGQQKVEALSKGMSQKVQFIATIIARPQLLLLDEPFSGLDPINTEVVRQVLMELVRNGTTVLFSTHDMAVAESLCDWIFMIYKGRKVLDGTLREIQEEHGSDVVRVRVAWPNGADRRLGDLPGVIGVTDFGNLQQLRLGPGADHQKLLEALMVRGRVERFEVAPPSLRDIFLQIAGGGEA
jgi:ABC-2 type transport system ATP-binding protein